MATLAGDKAVPQRSDVFISYSRKDSEFVRRLEKALESRGREAWVDWEGIRPTEEFMQAIYRAIESTDTFVFVISSDSVTSETCGRELAHAVSHNKRMIPIMARDVDAKAVPEPLAKLNWVFARETDSFDEATDTLISALDTDLGWVRAHTRLLTRAIEWEGKARSNSFVLRGEDLRSAEQWLAQAGTEKERQPTRLQTEYIIASRKAAARRQRITLGAVGLGAVVAVVLAVIAWLARNRAEDERRNAEAATKQATVARDEALKLIQFMTVDLRNKLQPIGRLDLLEDVNRRVRAFYDSSGTQEKSVELLREQGTLFNNQGNVVRSKGDLTSALQNYRDGVAVFERLTLQDPNNVDWQRGLSVNWGGVGDILREQGDLTGALQSHRESVRIIERLSLQEPDRTVWRADVSDSYVNLGDVQRELGDFTSAFKSYRDALIISEKLAQEDPGNIALQRDVAVCHERIGDLQRAQADVAGAFESYRRSLVIAQELAQRDPRDAGLQSDLSVALRKVGDLQTAQRDFSGALQSYREGLAIAEKLSRQDPVNADWQRDLSVCYNQIGDLRYAQGDLVGALQNYRSGLAIREKLVRQDADNTLWQRDLSLAYDNVGNIFSQQGDVAGALASYRQSLTIREKLTKKDPGNVRWQRDLSIVHMKVGDMQTIQGDLNGALESYSASVSVAEANVKPGGVAVENTLSLSYQKLGHLQRKRNDLKGALQCYRQALKLSQKLGEQDPDNAAWQGELALVYALTGTMQLMVDPESEKEGRIMMEKARDILVRLKSGVGLTPGQEPLLKSIEEQLQMTSPGKLQEANTDRKAGNKRRKGRQRQP